MAENTNSKFPTEADIVIVGVFFLLLFVILWPVMSGTKLYKKSSINFLVLFF